MEWKLTTNAAPQIQYRNVIRICLHANDFEMLNKILIRVIKQLFAYYL